MDIGKITDNYRYYEGFEGEAEIVLRIGNNFTVHIWDGYFDDIFNSPPLDGNGWTGFTRDYHELKGAFSSGTVDPVEIDPEEYLEDILRYKEKPFAFEETAGAFDTIVDALRSSAENKVKVTAELM